MLNKSQIEKIKELIDQGYSDYKIGKIINHSSNTVKKYRKILNKKKVKQNNEVVLHFENPLIRLNKMVIELDNILSSQKLQSEDYKQWQRRVDDLKAIIREHEERNSETREKEIKKTRYPMAKTYR